MTTIIYVDADAHSQLSSAVMPADAGTHVGRNSSNDGVVIPAGDGPQRCPQALCSPRLA